MSHELLWVPLTQEQIATLVGGDTVRIEIEPDKDRGFERGATIIIGPRPPKPEPS